jgi:two-component system, cell cycle sensor histidine kinase PleC
MNESCASEAERTNLILAEKLRLLYRGNFAVPANLVIACVVAYILSDTFPRTVLAAWLAVTAIVVVLRILLYRRFLKAVAQAPCSVCWARRFCIGALASGLLWGALSLGLPVWGTANDYVVMTLVIAGISAGALTTIVTYLPAFFCYVGSMILPLAAGLLQNPNAKIAATGWLMILFLFVIGFAAKNLSGSAIETIARHIDNEALNASLKQAQKERDAARTDKWSTLAQLSHELRTPLNAILGFSEAMHQEYFGPLGNARYKDYASHVHASGRHVLTLIDEILQLSQGESGALTLAESAVDLAAAIGNCLDVMGPVAQTGDVKLKADIAPGLPLLRADETKIRQMLINLTHNAIKFTPRHGEITIAAAGRKDGGIDLAVRDTGIGMMAEDIPLAMLPFGRIASPLKHENEGMGIGLPLCKRLAELHGAEFRIESEPGEGTTCTVSFPAERCCALHQAPAAAVA